MTILNNGGLMFDFLDMIDDREERLIENTIINEAEIDTCAVSDSDEPFETGIKHPKYNGNHWVIVEMYNTKRQAQIGHAKWVKVFSSVKLPKSLKYAGTSTIAELARAMGAI